MAKKLIVNCASCDARKVQESHYAGFEKIVVNCAAVVTSPASKAVMNKLPFMLNCADVMEVGEQADLRTVNGSCEIKSSDPVSEKEFCLMVNGSLTIGPDTQKQLKNCVGLLVNGSLSCAESVYPALAGLKVNGSTACYPDEAVVLKRSAVIDKLFPLRAKKRLYWSGNRLIMVDPELDAELLRNKGASFSAGEVIIAQSKAEALLDLIDDRADIILVPDGAVVVLDDVELGADALRRYGKQLYVIGDVTVPEQGDVLEQLSYLNVQGDARVPAERREKFLEVLTQITGKVKVGRSMGALLAGKPTLKVTKWMLEQQPKGIEISDCGFVQIAEDVPKQLITERLYIEGCGVVQCAKEQEDAVSMICEDVGKIGNVLEEAGMDAGVDIAEALNGIAGTPDTQVVNAAEYVL